ncbi:flagellar M-ring protein FliF [Candidatus Termititenax persephonae]|uniref:Flagellar M-ring protein FliF n=1 Tax=Candidatus Termititenax persephonae TaxID=2218525 RepID=A0A388TFP5_9BACT|nr:flagellar M-ring protein FliF [Candidatus Termititenax persephonae]
MGEEAKGGNKLIFIIIGIVAIAALAVLFLLFRPALSGGIKMAAAAVTPKKEAPSGYSVLFRNLDYTEAAQIVDSLKAQGVKDYRLEDDGRTILVPNRKRTEVVLAIAQEGIMPNGGAIGFEIFDKGSALGASEFDQNVKFSRAISGELVRSISRINGIEEARVIVVIPAQQLFAAQQNPKQASVLVKITEGELLTPQQVQAIVSLVSSSVEDLRRGNITVVDYNGRVLSSDEYARDYDRLAALLALEKSKKGNSIGSDLPIEDTGEIADESSIFSLYYESDRAKLNRQEKSLMRGININVNASEADVYAAKMKFKERYESLLERNIKQMADQFFPRKATEVKVNVELNNEPFNATTPNSMIERITAMILLDQYNQAVVLTPEVREAFMKSIASAISYVKGRDRIDLRWSPNVNVRGRKPTPSKIKTDSVPEVPAPKASKSESSTSSILSVLQQGSTDNRKNIYYLVGGLTVALLALILLLRRRKSSNVEKVGKKSVFDEQTDDREGFADLVSPSAEAIKDLAAQNPDKIAEILAKWFQEDEKKAPEQKPVQSAKPTPPAVNPSQPQQPSSPPPDKQ